jgi:hypothetical protein
LKSVCKTGRKEPRQNGVREGVRRCRRAIIANDANAGGEKDRK